MKPNQTDHNRQKKAAVINDYSSFGRCSLAVAAPLLSAMRVQCCPVPTAIFTNHTGFETFSWADCTDRMDAYINDWLAIGLRFSAIASGFLASERQLDFVLRFVQKFGGEDTLVMVDPVMGDYGRLYRTFHPEVAVGMRTLLDVADVMTPNLTEACILSGRPYDPKISESELAELSAELCVTRPKDVVISGIEHGGELLNFVRSRTGDIDVFSVPKIGADRSGTGDVFATVILGSLINGEPMAKAVRRAARFVSASVNRAEEMRLPLTDGLPIEETLPLLWSETE
jgi:Pyridoxal/pyridoxine/pyridoxamine kinase